MEPTTQNPTPKTQNSPLAPSPVLSLAAKTVDDVLRRFGETIEEARENYRDFVEKGIALGKRPEFQGGGLIRSMGGKKEALMELRRGNIEKSDPRVLGSGGFVNLTLEQSEKILEKKYQPKKSIEELIETIAEQFGLLPKLICAGGRRHDISKARATIAYMAVAETGHSAADVARYLGVKESSVLQSLKKGKCCFEQYQLKIIN